MGTDLSSSDRAESLALLSTVERTRYDETPSLRFLAGRLLLRRLVAELTHTTPDTVVITAVCADCGGAHGRPETPGVHVSLSHGEGVVVAAASGSVVGVDVETRVGRRERLDAIEALTGVRDIRSWTRTEAVLKADGRGLRVDPTEVAFTGDRAILAGVSYDVSEVQLRDDLVVSVAVGVTR